MDKPYQYQPTSVLLIYYTHPSYSKGTTVCMKKANFCTIIFYFLDERTVFID